MSEDMTRLKQMAWGRLQHHIEEQSGSLRANIDGRRESAWPGDDDVLTKIENIDDGDKREKLLNEAFLDLQQRVVRVALEFLAAEQNPQQGTDALKAAVEDLLIGLHNPQTRESLLIAVQDQYRDDVRQRFSEFGQLFWGLADANSQRQTEEMWFLLSVVAAHEDRSLKELAKEADGISAEEIPDEYR